MAPRKPIADSANMPPEASPNSVGLMPPSRDAFALALADKRSLGRHDHHAGGGDQDRRHHRPGHDIAEKNEPEHRDLDRFGLDVGDGDDERALAHGGKHQRGGGDLRKRAVDHPGPKAQPRPRQRRAGRHQHAGKKNDREGKTEQKPHMRRADGAETAGQLALHRVAQGLGECGNDGEDGPKPAGQHYAAFSATTM